MSNKANSANFRAGSLNTLAQNGTEISNQMPVIIQGQGSELGNDKAMKGKTKRKIITQKMALTLIDIAKGKEQYECKKAYWNTYHCQNRIYSFEGRLYGKYCKNRHCTLCTAIRKAEIINKYYPVIKQWAEPYFVTLTFRSCKLPSLKKMMRAALRAFRLINEKYRKRNQRGKGLRLIGIKSLECNFNPVRQTYNPHLHLVVATKEIAETIRREWLSIWTSKFTYHKAQVLRPVKDIERDLIETIKYGSKIFTEPDVNNKARYKKADKDIYAAALYNIFAAMKGLRIFDRFGFDLPKESKRKPSGARVVHGYAEWVFTPEFADWLNTENELMLTAYQPPPELENLLAYRINTDLE